MLKVSPRKGVIRFGKRGKLNPRYIRPFKILERIGPVAYKLELLEELSNVHNTFHVSNLKKCLSDESLVILMKELRLDDTTQTLWKTLELCIEKSTTETKSYSNRCKVILNSKRGQNLHAEPHKHPKNTSTCNATLQLIPTHHSSFHDSAKAEQELFETVKAFHACKQEEGKSISTYVLKMKAYLDQMERLGCPMPLVLGVNMILTSLSKDYDQFVQNYNMHVMGKTKPELHAMLKLTEMGIPKKTPAVLAIRQGQIQKPKSQARGKGKQRGKGKSKLVYDPKHKIPPPSKKEHPAKDTKCHHCYKTGHWKRNCPLYLAELKKNKASASGTSGLRGYRKLNKGALDLYVGNGNTAAVEAIGSFDLILPS
ncbi:zinc finger, CCHC-type containing protein [Tanacetum coccineum]|uniref:Zinc finger, CCHC-type containing protein n=1 Tax=Tanacetum coccineum TaxID=301880 RepID=A0ABQ5ATD4_9ASTR